MFDWFRKLMAGIFDPDVSDEYDVPGDASKCPFLNPGLVKEEPEPSVEQVSEISAKYPEFDKAFEKFNPKTDMLVVSEEYIKDFDSIYVGKLESLSDRLIVFPKGTLVERNVAVVTVGYSAYNYNGIKKTT